MSKLDGPAVGQPVERLAADAGAPSGRVSRRSLAGAVARFARSFLITLGALVAVGVGATAFAASDPSKEALTSSAQAAPTPATTRAVLPVNPYTHLPPGMMPKTVGVQPAAAPAGAHLTYYGGPVVSNAQVEQVLYGGTAATYEPEVWNTTTASIATFFANVQVSQYVDWLTEYNTPQPSAGTGQIIGRGTFHQQLHITPSAANAGMPGGTHPAPWVLVDDSNIQAELQAQIASNHLPGPTANTIYAVYFPKQVQISQGGTYSGVAGGFCAYHGTIASTPANILYIVMPDFGPGSGNDSGCGNASSEFGNVTSVSSHELIETITDADVGIGTTVGYPLAWYDPTNGEIGDICNASQGTVLGGDGVTYTVQLEFSNVANNCIVSRAVGGHPIEPLTSPQRLVDTRSSGGPIAAGTSRCFNIAGLGGIPTDAAAAVLNVTAVTYGANGWLTLYPNGYSVPATSTLNFDTNENAIANGAIIRIGSSGQVCVNAGQAASNVILDATGYVANANAAQLELLTSPQRLADTRSTGGPIAAGTSRCFNIAGLGGIPTGATAAVLNVTAVTYGANGWLTLFPNGQAVPSTSTLNFDTHEYAIANGATVRIGSSGQVCVNAGQSASNVIIDATGYVSSAAAQLPQLTSPQRLVDTRSSGGPIAAGTSRCFPVAGMGGIPANALAVILNVTGVTYAGNGWLTLFPNGQSVPSTSTLNFDTHENAIANGAAIKVGTSGQVCVSAGQSASNVILDATAYELP